MAPKFSRDDVRKIAEGIAKPSQLKRATSFLRGASPEARKYGRTIEGGEAKKHFEDLADRMKLSPSQRAKLMGVANDPDKAQRALREIQRERAEQEKKAA